MDRSQAVRQIRYAVFDRDGWQCIHCGQLVDKQSGELDERQARGKCKQQPDGDFQSGEVSIANCQTMCRQCHTGPGGKHDRALSFSRGSNAALQT
jgi:5-methylcytosine-specific restriction endonuclease McrA